MNVWLKNVYLELDWMLHLFDLWIESAYEDILNDSELVIVVGMSSVSVHQLISL